VNCTKVIIVTPPPLKVLVRDVPPPMVIKVGVPGPAGPGVPGNGATGTVLIKQSPADNDTAWAPVGQTPDLVRFGLEQAYDYAVAHFYTEFTYASGVLSQIDIYTNSSKTTKLFSKVFTYTSGVLTSIVVTRVSDSSTLTKTFTYTSGVLTSITRS